MTETNEAGNCGSGFRCARGVVLALAAGLLWAAPAWVSAEVRNPTGVAVIIGNKAYDHERVPEVSYAHRDAAAFKRYVVDVLGYDEANIIELLDASQGELETAFGNERSHEGTLWRYLDPEFGSDVVVFYSGHGVPGLNDGRGYLLPGDADPNTAEINGYPIDVLYENLGKLEEARKVTVYLDACFSGDSHEGMLVRSASPVYVSGELPGAAGEKVTVLTAASGTQLASWDEEAGHGLFTEHLLEALYGKGDADGDGRVTADEAVTYLRRHMTRAARRVYGRHQHATLNGMPGVVLARAVGGLFPARPVLGVDSVEPKQAAAAPAAPGSRDQVQRDLLLLGMREANAAGNHERVLEYAAKLAELGGELPVEAKYYQVQAYVEAGRNEEGIAELTAYLEATGREGEHYQEALGQLLRLNERLGEEDEAYDGAQGNGTAAAYGAYLRRYPSGRHAEEARRLQEEAEAREDEAAYRQAQATGTAAAYGEYLRRYPAGRHAREAGQRREQKDLMRPGKRFKECAECPELVVVAAGSFMMGSPVSEERRDDNEGPVHRVTIGSPFAVGVYEVTFEEWDACVRDGGCRGYRAGDAGWGRGRRPVINVSWRDAQDYVRWLRRETGEEYRLLSESEWEYVARAGTRTAFHFGRTIMTSQANFDGNYTYGSGKKGEYRKRTLPVGSFAANGFGLYDVHGNVWEWVADCWNDSYHGAPSDGGAWERGDCDRRVVRGGSWYNAPWSLRSANRSRGRLGATVAAASGFELPGRSPHESLPLYLGGPGGGAPWRQSGPRYLKEP